MICTSSKLTFLFSSLKMEGKEKLNYINQIKPNKIKKPQIKRQYCSNTYQRKDWGPPYREKSQASILTNETQLKKLQRGIMGIWAELNWNLLLFFW